MEVQDLPSFNSQTTSYSSFLSDQEPGSRTGDSFNGFDHEEALRINNASTTEMLNLELEFDSVQKRLETFIRWPVDSPVKPRDLAVAGFRSSGLDDRVVCFKCDLHLRQWRTGEDPWTEHKRLRPRCPFVLECECENGDEVHDSPAGTSNLSKAQDPGEIAFVQNYPRYGHPNYPAKNVGHTNMEMVSGTRMPSYHDPNRVPYSERPYYVTQAGEYGYHEQPYVNRHPADVQTGYHDQQVYYPGRTQEFLGRDSRLSQFQRPEHQRIGTEVTRHVVVKQGSSQVHIVGSGAAMYQLNPTDKLVIQSGNQGHPQQVRPVRDLTSMYPEANQTSRFTSQLETSFTGSESRRYSPEEPLSNKYQSSSSTVSYAPSYTGQFTKQPGFEYPVEENLTEEKGTVEFRRSVSHNTGLPQGRNRSAKYMQYQGRSHSEEQVKYMNTVHETSAPNQPPFRQKAPETFYEPYTTEKKVSSEDGLVQENCYRPQQRYPGTKSEMTETSPFPPPRETNRWQEPGRNEPPAGRNVQGRRRPAPFAAFPVRDPSLEPAQRPLIRHEDARHVTSSADLASEHHRLTTFVDWPHDHPLRPVDLAAAGFYYLGTGDSVKCYRCGIPLHNWDPTDTPWGEHQKWKPQCPLVLEHLRGRPSEREEHAPRQRTTSQERFTVPQEAFQYRRPQQSHGLSDQQVPIRSGDPPVHGTWGRSESFPVTTVANVVRPQRLPLDQQQPHWQTQPVTTSQEGDMTSGLKSGSSGGESGSSQDRRSCSPRGSTSLELDLEKLAEMGFTQQQINDTINAQIETTGSTFSSYADLVSALLEGQARQPTNRTCPQPGHQRCEPASPPPSPISPFPTDITSSPPRQNQDFRERNCVSAVSSPTSPGPDVSSLCRSLSAPMPRSSESGEESLEEKLERMQEERMCKICMDAEVSVVFLPCGHLSCCANCANGMDFCPMCRAPIQEKIRTYLS